MVSGPASGADDVADMRPNAEARWIAEEGLQALDQAIAKLPRALKEPLLLTAVEGLSRAQAGRELGISAKAVETRVRRARLALAAAVGARTST